MDTCQLPHTTEPLAGDGSMNRADGSVTLTVTPERLSRM
jgi:hypothetical protein